jgi:hypothetical protein
LLFLTQVDHSVIPRSGKRGQADLRDFLFRPQNNGNCGKSGTGTRVELCLGAGHGL